MSKGQLEQITGRAPVDKKAAMVMARGEHYNPQIKIQQAHWSAPPPTIPVLKGQDLTGKRVGRLTVVGKHSSNKSKGAIWLVRCDCGDYETRSSKSINNPENHGDRCVYCRNLTYLKAKDILRRTGRDVDRRKL